MSYGYCPSCVNQLNDESVIMTKQSEVFKGSNVYMICKHCQRVVLYNKDRDIIFDLDEYQDDQEVLKELARLLEDLDPNLEIASQEENTCSQDCATCAACSGCNDEQYQGYFSRKQEKSVPEEPVEEFKEEIIEIQEEDVQVALSNALLAVNKQDVSIKKIFVADDLNDINIDEWVFFDLQPVKIKQVISYEIERL